MIVIRCLWGFVLILESRNTTTQHNTTNQMSVLQDADDYQLENIWTVWYDAPPTTTEDSAQQSIASGGGGVAASSESSTPVNKPVETAAQWANRLSQVTNVMTIKEFWRAMRALPCANLQPSVSLYLFKSGVRPMWEDPLNKGGGRWLLSVPKWAEVEKLWENTCMALVGETIGTSVCGVVLTAKKKSQQQQQQQQGQQGPSPSTSPAPTRGGERLALWLRGNTSEEDIKKAGAAWRKALELPETTIIDWQLHDRPRPRTIV